jgi:hypothetical protein
MAYITIFDAARDCREASRWVPALAFVCCFIGAFCLRSAMARVFGDVKLWGGPPSISAWIGIGLFSLAPSVLLFGSFGDCTDASALREGRFSIVEGPVTEFDQYFGGVFGKGESFRVSGKRFTVTQYNASAGERGGFHQLSSQGGPIRDGLNVRIAYSGSEILRLEIAK